MSDEIITELRISNAKVSTAIEGITKILDRHEQSHEDHYKETREHGEEIADINAARRTAKWIIGLFGSGGALAGLLKWGGQ